MTKQERADNIWVREDIERVFKIGRNTAYGLLRDKTCPSKKDGKSWTVFAEDFCEWYRNRKKNSRERET